MTGGENRGLMSKQWGQEYDMLHKHAKQIQNYPVAHGKPLELRGGLICASPSPYWELFTVPVDRHRDHLQLIVRA